MGDALATLGRLRYTMYSDAAGASSDVDGGRVAIMNGEGGLVGLDWCKFVASSGTRRCIRLTTISFALISVVCSAFIDGRVVVMYGWC